MGIVLERADGVFAWRPDSETKLSVEKIGTIVVIFASIGAIIEGLRRFVGAVRRSIRSLAAWIFGERQISRVDRHEVRSLRRRARALIQEGRLAAATAVLDRAIELHPRSADAYLLRGKAQLGVGEFKIAIQDLTRCCQIAPDWAETYYLRGQAWEGASNGPSALTDYKRAAKLGHQRAAASVTRLRGSEGHASSALPVETPDPSNERPTMH